MGFIVVSGGLMGRTKEGDRGVYVRALDFL